VIDLDLSGETVIGEYRQPNLIFIPSFIYVLIALSILIIGTAISLIWGQYIYSWYWSLIML